MPRSDPVTTLGLSAPVERTALYLIQEAGHELDYAIAMAINLTGGKVPHPVRQQVRRCRSVTMTPEEREGFADVLLARRRLVEGVLLSLDGADVREGAVLSAHALCEARQGKRPVRLSIGGAQAELGQVRNARARLGSEVELIDELVEAAVEKHEKRKVVMREGIGGGKPHARVVHLQNRLNSLGHRVAADGVFGPVTAEAVKDFQAKAGMDPTGEVDDDTMTALRHGRVKAPELSPALAAQVAAPVDADGDSDADSDGDGDGDAKPKLQVVPAPVGLGAGVGEDGNPDVQKVQKALSDTGHPLAQDGAFGPATAAALKKFQRAHGLVVTGVADDRTKRALKLAEGRVELTLREDWAKFDAARALKGIHGVRASLDGMEKARDREDAEGYEGHLRMARDGLDRMTQAMPEHPVKRILRSARMQLENPAGDGPRADAAGGMLLQAESTLGPLEAVTQEAACECGAPVRGVVCQRGHRVEEAWSPAARLASARARHRLRSEGYAARDGVRFKAKLPVREIEEAWSDAALEESWLKWNAEHHDHGDLVTHLEGMKSGHRLTFKGSGVHVLKRKQGYQVGGRTISGEHEAAVEAMRLHRAAPKRSLMDRTRGGSGADWRGGALTLMRQSAEMDLEEDWSARARASALETRRRMAMLGSLSPPVWMHSETGHQFREGDHVSLPGSPSGVGRIERLVQTADGPRVRLVAPHGEFDVKPDSLRVPQWRKDALTLMRQTVDALDPEGTNEDLREWLTAMRQSADEGVLAPPRLAMTNQAVSDGESSLEESKETAMLSVKHAPIGHGGVNWITQSKPGNTGQMPAYLQNVRNAIMRSGKSVSEATAIAVGRVRDWAEGRGNVGPEVKAAAAKAIAEWEAMRGAAHVKHAAKKVAEADTTADHPELPVKCPECGAPMRGKVCQRGHRMELREDWSKWDAVRGRLPKGSTPGDRHTLKAGPVRLEVEHTPTHEQLKAELHSARLAKAVKAVKAGDLSKAADQVRALSQLGSPLADRARALASRVESGAAGPEEIRQLHDDLRSKTGLRARDIEEAWSPAARAASALSRRSHDHAVFSTLGPHRMPGDQLAQTAGVPREHLDDMVSRGELMHETNAFGKRTYRNAWKREPERAAMLSTLHSYKSAATAPFNEPRLA